MIIVSINGIPRQLTNSINVTELVALLGYTGQRIAIEHNGAIVPRSRFATQQILDNDKIEVVVAVGGG